ncbi:myotubularin-related protein 3 isoform X3 [Aphidius gifuensis]|uniref:myotubularin-related protein 3 isoform X3 n=1 Tax=Aphidius gifuensis TaxID=684658 RepID=UPI001CDD1B53|nr:myotubularin-related protein 3 isoform X3 [Aphidius gifuensis]
MESSEETTSLQSICHLRASELFPKHAQFENEDPSLTVPFTPLSGEFVVALGRTSDGILALSNYRLYLQLSQACYNIPLGLIEQLEVKEIFYLHIGCKDARSVSCAFTTNEHCLEWFKRLHKVTYPRKSIEDIFAFGYYAWSIEEGKSTYPRLGKLNTTYSTTFNSEVERMKFNLHGSWRISQMNKDYRICPSYPPQLLVPACINDETLEAVAKFRSSRRIPAIVWRHTGNGAVIARSSQPEVGWLGWRSDEDEELLKALSAACSYDRGESTMIDTHITTNDVQQIDETIITTNNKKKVLIVDARSYTTAVANRARGGGCECPDYYPTCDIQFMNLPNIHSIRKSFHSVRQLCASDADQPNWLSLLEGTRWLQHMSGLLRAAVTVASAIERDGRPVLVHCSDGWDRTPQIVALAQILLDPYYRTMEGFQILCEREWLDFGHKFADRCGQTVGCEDPNERCPVFLQWLDCVHQLIRQFQCSFQMSSAYIVKLAQHTYSQLFGTFLCNTRQERLHLSIRERTFSVWKFLNSSSFLNHLYSPTKNQILWPSCNVRDLVLWSEVYLGSMDISPKPDKQRVSSLIDIETSENEEPQGQMTKTRSYGDLIHAPDHLVYLHRRLSDPSISIEKKFDSTNIDNESDKTEDDDDDDNTDEKINAIEESCTDIDSRKNSYNINQKINDISANPSVDSSTDTLIPNSEPASITKDEVDTIQKPNEPADNTNSCLDNNGIVNRGGTCICNRFQHEESDVSETSIPIVSRTPSSICPASPTHQDIIIDNPSDSIDDVDGLPVIHCDVQLRVQQIIVEHKVKEEALRKELHTTRLALIKQVCNIHSADTDRIDDIGSLPDSVGSVGDHGESLPSEMSWEAVEELGPAPTLWVPDHAVNRCMGCDTEFWLGRRKHHCRCCGRIFCADCSENSTPLPSEQLYNPVRVCSECFSRLHHHTSPCQCARNIIKNQDNDITEKTTITLASTTVTPTTPTTLTTTITTTTTTTTTNNNTDLTSLLCPRLKIISVSKEGCAEASLQANQQKSQPSTVTSQAVN